RPAVRYIAPPLLPFSVLDVPPSPTLFPYTTLFRSPRTTAAAARATHRPIIFANWATWIAAALMASPCIASHVPAREIRAATAARSEEHTSELQSRENLVCRLLLEKKKNVAWVQSYL